MAYTQMKREALPSSFSPQPETHTCHSPNSSSSPSSALTPHGQARAPLPTTTNCREFERVFRQFDEDGDGKISPAELCACMRAVGEELSLEDAVAAVESTDSDGDGLLALDDFVKLAEAEGEEEKRRDLRGAFDMYKDGQGCSITSGSLKRMLSRLGKSRGVEECMAMIRRFDLDGDGVISFDEFRVMMI